MRLKPVRFIAHKLGPFDHVELKWGGESRYTLIVAENGMGKTTLVTAMAACLSFDSETLFKNVGNQFERFVQDRDAFAYLELDYEGQVGWIFRWPSESSLMADRNPQRVVNELIGSHISVGVTHIGYLSYSANLATLAHALTSAIKLKALAAAYGVSRDLANPHIEGFNEIGDKPLKDALNPFAPGASTEIFQWIANQHINRALAIAENKPAEAEAYQAAIQRVERLLSKGLAYPLSFRVERNPFRIEARQNGTALTIEQLSDGTRSFLSWTLDYLMRASRANWENPADSALAPGLILVDEIDAHLHPEWQRRIMAAVSQLLPETYIIATTHSPFVVGATDDAQVFQIYKDAAGQLQVKSSFDELYGYPADLVLEKAFVPSLYPPEIEQKRQHLADLARKVAAGTITSKEGKEHDRLMKDLAEVNAWLDSLLAVAQAERAGQ